MSLKHSQTDRQTDRQRDRQRDRQQYWTADIYIYIYIYIYIQDIDIIQDRHLTSLCTDISVAWITHRM